MDTELSHDSDSATNVSNLKDRIANKTDLNGQIETKATEEKDSSDQEINETGTAVYANGGCADNNGYDYDDNEDETDEIGPIQAPKCDYSLDYFALYQDSVLSNDIMRQKCEAFKRRITSNLYILKEECHRENRKLKRLFAEKNAVMQDKKRMLGTKDKIIKAKENDNKALRTKNNDMKSEIARIKQSIEKVKKEQSDKTEQINKMNDKLKKENAICKEKLEKEKRNVEMERKERLSVTDKNGEYLRKEKAKISLQLDRVKRDSHGLEQELSALQEQSKEKQSLVNSYITKMKSLNEKEKQSQNIKQKLIKERDDAINSLSNKAKQFKMEQSIFNQTQTEIQTLRKQQQNQRNEIKILHESIRKKSEKEKQFDVIRKKLVNREKKLEQREKEMKEKYKRNNRRNQPKQSNSGSSSKGGKENSMLGPNDPLNQYKNVLPFHWICIFLLISLMVSIAQRR